MSPKERTVSFFYLTQEKKVGDEWQSVAREEVEQNFASVYSGMKDLKNGRRAEFANLGDARVVVEVITYSAEAHYAFVKIGYQNHPNTAGLRDQKTLEAEAIQRNENQSVELYTCCYIDFETCIVSYIGVRSAPSIRALKSLLDASQKEVTSTFSSILHYEFVEDIKNSRVTKLEVTVATPGDRVLSDLIGVGAADFDYLGSVKNVKQTYTLTAESQKNLFKSPNAMGQFVDRMQENLGEWLHKCRVTTKDDMGTKSIVDLLQEGIVYKSYIKVDNANALDDMDTTLQSLKACYLSQKETLCGYIR